MSAVARLRVRTARDVVAAPVSAVFRDGQRDAVWVVANGKARKRLVRLGAQGESRAEVLDGLTAGRAHRRARRRPGARRAAGAVTAARSAVEARDVARSYRLDGVSVEALRGVTLRIDQGDYVAIVGPSGSGKSTLMHLLGCLDRPTSGSLLLGGRDVAALSDAELAELRNQHDRLRLPVLPAAGADQRAGERRAAAGLPGRAASRAAAPRGGAHSTRSGWATGSSTVPASSPAASSSAWRSPARWSASRRVLLADEPTGNLDSRSGADVMALLGRLNSERGVAVVVVTHDLEVAGHAASAHRRA